MSGNDRSPYGYSAPKPKKNMEDDDGPSRKVAPGGSGAGISFAPMAPSFAPMGMDMSSMNARPQKAAAISQPLHMQQRQHTSATPFRWRLAEVPTLPEFHPLERTAVFCEHTSASEVTSRVSSILRKLSVEASYDDDKAKVKCVSASGVEFRVFLYRGRREYSHGIIVEVQRRFGYSMDFEEITRAILDAAQGLPAAAISAATTGYLPMVVDDEEDVPPPPSGASSLRMISMMFGNQGYDSDYLALQTLASLTDASRMGAATAKSVSTELLVPGNEVGTKLTQLIVKNPSDDLVNLQVLALTILANALSAIKGKISEDLHEAVRPKLVQVLENATESNILLAQQAARYIECTWQDDEDIDELQSALQKAQVVGQSRHMGLERQAAATLSKMKV